MTFLQNTLAALTANVHEFEAQLAKHGHPPVHLWQPTHYDGLDDSERHVPPAAFALVEKIRADANAISAAVTPTRLKHLSLGLSALNAAALDVAVTLGISDAIKDLGGQASLSMLAGRLSVNENKLGRILRLLASEYIYRQVSPDVFANTRHGTTLLKQEKSEPFLSLLGQYNTLSATGLLKNMTDMESKHSFAAEKAPFCSAVSPNGETFMEYMMQPEHADVAAKVADGVVPWLNRITRAPLVHSYAWSELGDSVVVDLGCGPGDSAMDILRQYPRLRWVFQDVAAVVDGLKFSFPEEFKAKVEAGDISFVVQDYLEPNKSEGHVWYMRGVIREHPADEVLQILKHVANGMRKTPGSRLLINEILVSTVAVVPSSESLGAAVPSEHIPAQQSALPDVADLMTWNTFCFFGGHERSFPEIEALLEQAGLRVSGFSKLSTMTVMIEAVIA
ncbi:S-adenosyl-L-methionine-dependent methyltransferase [Dactylonectria macrodidyma]|uniref:S-adenosyl-L-methionine-dependent methyltransferase n=1 Tax=Dactylonectria macrodidyma TaxID=307937 RepID=A0A9P9F852_9HYPO|nr:S-adenosyl-L-methionine-dependent methyltransferase [Dactylonectria macrodidyma]